MLFPYINICHSANTNCKMFPYICIYVSAYEYGKLYALYNCTQLVHFIFISSILHIHVLIWKPDTLKHQSNLQGNITTVHHLADFRVLEVLHNSCNIGTRALPDMYALALGR